VCGQLADWPVVVAGELDQGRPDGPGSAVADAYWAIAPTRRGRIAVYEAYRNEWPPAQLDDYDALVEAEHRGNAPSRLDLHGSDGSGLDQTIGLHI
jgi:hypothetical protein